MIFNVSTMIALDLRKYLESQFSVEQFCRLQDQGSSGRIQVHRGDGRKSRHPDFDFTKHKEGPG